MTMNHRVPRRALIALRNDIDIADLIDHLGIPSKLSEGYKRFLCPLCRDTHTAINPRTNLARCFSCVRNFNPIDLVIEEKGVSFQGAVDYLLSVKNNLRPNRHFSRQPGKRPHARQLRRFELG